MSHVFDNTDADMSRKPAAAAVFDAEENNKPATSPGSVPPQSRRLEDHRSSPTRPQSYETMFRVQMPRSEDYTTPIDLVVAGRDKGEVSAAAMTHADAAKLARKKKAQEYMEKNRIIDPNSGFRTRWDVAQVVLLLYVAVVVPCKEFRC